MGYCLKSPMMSALPSRGRQHDLVVRLWRGVWRACHGVVFQPFSLKSVMLFLVALCVAGNALFTFSSSYPMLALGRFISGFPHGAYFGVGAIILSKIASPGRVTAAVAGMIAGMTVANLLGVPAGTLGHQFNWRYTFTAIALFDVLVLLAILRWVPTLYDKSTTRLSEQFHFLKSPAPWFIFAATMFGNAGVLLV